MSTRPVRHPSHHPVSRRRVLLGIPAVAVAAKLATPDPTAAALKKKPECVADLIRPS